MRLAYVGSYVTSKPMAFCKGNIDEMRMKRLLVLSVMGSTFLVSIFIWGISKIVIDVTTQTNQKLTTQMKVEKSEQSFKNIEEGFFISKGDTSVSKSGYIVDKYTLPTYAERIASFMKSSGIGDGTITELSVNDFFITDTGNLAATYDGLSYLFTGKQVVGVFGNKEEQFFRKINETYKYMTLGIDFLSGKYGVYDPKYVAYRSENDDLKLTYLDLDIQLIDKKPNNSPKNIESLTGYKFQKTGKSYNSRGNSFTFLSYVDKEGVTHFFNTDGIAIGGIYKSEEDFEKAYNSLRIYGPTKIGMYQDGYLVLLEVAG